MCGGAFATPYETKQYCSGRCRERRKYKYVPTPRPEAQPKAPWRGECSGCGTELRGRKRRYCGEQCRPKTLVDRECPICSQAFSTSYPDKIYCSRTCQNRKWYGHEPGRPPSPVCKGCGKSFSGYKHQRYCSRTCYLRHHHPPAQTKEHTCSACGIGFVGYARRKFCSHLCKWADYYSALVHGPQKTKAEKIRANVQPVSKDCIECGERFLAILAKRCEHCRDGKHRKYGITGGDLRRLREASGNCCYICAAPEDIGFRQLCIDHCHRTGQVRGLLCTNCNTGIGGLKDNAELLRKAAIYLEQPKLIA